MNLPALKAELLAVLTSTTNISAGEKTKLRDRCVTLYLTDFARYLSENALADNATNRGKFYIEKTVGNKQPGIIGHWSTIWYDGNQKEREAAMPAVEHFE